MYSEILRQFGSRKTFLSSLFLLQYKNSFTEPGVNKKKFGIIIESAERRRRKRDSVEVVRIQAPDFSLSEQKSFIIYIIYIK